MTRAKTAARRKPVYLSTLLRRIGACPASIAWARSRRGMPGGLRATWESCASSRDAEWLCFLCWLLMTSGHLDVSATERAALHSGGLSDVQTRKQFSFERVLAALERAAVAS